MKKLLLYITTLAITTNSLSQNVGIGTTAPTHFFHISPTSVVDPIRIEGLQNFNNETNVLVVDPTIGIIKHMAFGQLLLGNDTIFFNDTSYTLVRDSLLNDSIFLDSLILIFGDSIDTDIDSMRFANDTLYLYEDDQILTTYINTNPNINLIDSLIIANSDTLYSFISDSLTKDTSWIKQIDSLIGIYGNTVFFNDSSYTLYRDSLLNDKYFLDSLINLIKDTINTDDQNLDSLTLNGTILTGYIENGASKNINLQPIIDSAIANSVGGNDNDWNINTNGTGLESAPSANNSASGIYSITAGFLDSATALYTTVSGGSLNHASGTTSTISGGINNKSSGSFSVISGGRENISSGYISTISGGLRNNTPGEHSIVSGGIDNIASGAMSTVSGGKHNVAQSYGEWVGGLYSTIGSGNRAIFVPTDRLFVIGNGGSSSNRSNALTLYKNGSLEINEEFTFPNTDGTANQVLQTDGNGNVSWNTINTSGGSDNDWNINANGTGLEGTPGTNISSGLNSISAGRQNTASGNFSASYGDSNIASGNHSFAAGNRNISSADYAVAFGDRDTASGYRATISGGGENIASNTHAVISGGHLNTASGLNSVIGGGSRNTASDNISVVSGGQLNHAEGPLTTISGGQSNHTIGNSSTISGGFQNITNGNYASISGGRENSASGISASISGGNINIATGNYSVISGGSENTSAGNLSTISGGFRNTASIWHSTVSGGSYNSSTGQGSTVSGGQTNSASGYASTVSGGASNNALGSHSNISGGRQDTAYGDYSTVSGGFQNTAFSFGEWVGGLYATEYTPNSAVGFDLNDRLFVVGNGVSSLNRSNALTIFKNGNATLSGTLTQSSDKRLKENIIKIKKPLDKLMNLNGYTYYWKDKEKREKGLQIGLIAQEVEKVFPSLVKEINPKTKGVNYISLIPVLIEAIKEQQTTITTQNNQNKKLETRIEKLEKLVNQLSNKNK